MLFHYGMLALVLSAIGLTLIYTIKTGISPVPTSPRVRDKMLAMIPPERLAAIERGRLFDLGSGWGTLAFALAKRSRAPFSCFCGGRTWRCGAPTSWAHR